MEFIIIIIGLVLDRISKVWALKYLSKIQQIDVIHNFFSLFYLENKGAAFGIFQNKVILLSIVTFVILIGIVVYLIKYRPKNKLLRFCLSLIIAGAIGNLIDRLVYGYVVDFILLHYKDVYSFAVFNVADSFVVVGTFLLAICILKEGK